MKTHRLMSLTGRASALLFASLSLAVSSSAWASCSYTITNNWGAGYTGEITVTNNTNQAVSNWSVNWKDAGTISNVWNANLSGANPYTATSMSWNGTLAPNASASFGFQAAGSASVAVVTGSLCGTAASVSSSSSMAASSKPASSKAASSVALSSKPASSIAASSKPASSVAPSSRAASSSAAIAKVFQEAQAGFCSVDGSIDSNNSGFTGDGFANTDNTQGAAIHWAISAAVSGRYSLTFRFANGGSTNRDGSLLINGGSNGNYTLNLPATGSWTNWQTVSLELDLVQGNNTVKLSALTKDGLANIDSLTVTGAAVVAGTCSGGSSSVASASSSVRSSLPVSSAASSSSVPDAGQLLPQTGNPVHSRFNKLKTLWGSDKADIILSYQYTNGGWPKNQEYSSPGTGGTGLGTIDNGATTSEMTYLANIYRDGKNTKYRDSVRKAMDYLLAAQYSSGGWPQFYPLKGGYADHVTFNDNAMSRVLTVLHHAVLKTAPFDTDVITDSQRAKAETAIAKGVDYILKSQWKQNGKLTVWCAQHGKDDYQPKAARAYELESLSGSESVEVIAFLMTQPQTPAVATAVKAGLSWFRSPNTYLANYTYDSSVEEKIVPKSGSKMWYRFYKLDTNRGFFSDRDGGTYYDIMQISAERRNGYSWGGDYGSNLIKYAESVGY
jgi:PelA/Pel-15E family pectate lyase